MNKKRHTLLKKQTSKLFHLFGWFVVFVILFGSAQYITNQKQLTKLEKSLFSPLIKK